MRISILILFILVSANLFSQTNTGYLVGSKVVGVDTLPHIRLQTVYILPPREFKSKKERRRFIKLTRKIKKVLPYAKTAGIILYNLEQELLLIESEKEQKKVINRVDKELKERYTEELKKLKISEGRLLIKLIDRETGDTSFELIKDLRGGFSAFMWQSMARLFGEDLKESYDGVGNDKLIEEIIIRIENGEL